MHFCHVIRSFVVSREIFETSQTLVSLPMDVTHVILQTAVIQFNIAFRALYVVSQILIADVFTEIVVTSELFAALEAEGIKAILVIFLHVGHKMIECFEADFAENTNRSYVQFYRYHTDADVPVKFDAVFFDQMVHQLEYIIEICLTHVA